MRIKDRIKYLRESKGWTMAILARETGITPTTISHIEKGRNEPSSEVLKKIAIALGTSTDYLLGVDEDSISKIKIRDKKLLEQFKQIDQLEKEEREMAKALLSAFLSKRPIKKFSP